MSATPEISPFPPFQICSPISPDRDDRTATIGRRFFSFSPQNESFSLFSKSSFSLNRRTVAIERKTHSPLPPQNAERKEPPPNTEEPTPPKRKRAISLREIYRKMRGCKGPLESLHFASQHAERLHVRDLYMVLMKIQEMTSVNKEELSLITREISKCVGALSVNHQINLIRWMVDKDHVDRNLLQAISLSLNIQNLRAKTLCFIVQAFAKMQIFDETLFLKIADQSVQEIKEFSSKELAILSESFAKLGLFHKGLSFAIIRRIYQSNLKKFSQYDLSIIAWALTVWSLLDKSSENSSHMRTAIGIFIKHIKTASPFRIVRKLYQVEGYLEQLKVKPHLPFTRLLRRKRKKHNDRSFPKRAVHVRFDKTLIFNRFKFTSRSLYRGCYVDFLLEINTAILFQTHHDFSTDYSGTHYLLGSTRANYHLLGKFGKKVIFMPETILEERFLTLVNHEKKSV